MKVGSLFTGIGGIDLAFAAAGFEIPWQVEIDAFCRKVLAKHERYWKRAVVFADVRDVGEHNLCPVDGIVGGFPCQDISVAGKGLGLAGARSGLWWEFARVIGELRPRFVFVENVPAITSRGGCDVVGSLTKMGYDCSWGIVPASAAGAPHHRDRFWLVGYANGGGRHTARAIQEGRGGEIGEDTACQQAGQHVVYPFGPAGDAVRHTNSKRCRKSQSASERSESGWSARRSASRKSARLHQSRVGRGAYGLSARLDRHQFPVPMGMAQRKHEPARTVDTPGKNHRHRIKALGNAVVPQVVLPMAVMIRERLADDFQEVG
jgi:DNA (cytosine-5)-methyltransferase 1